MWNINWKSVKKVLLASINPSTPSEPVDDDDYAYDDGDYVLK